MGAELIHADRQTDMTKLIFAFHNFVSVPKIRNQVSIKWNCRALF